MKKAQNTGKKVNKFSECAIIVSLKWIYAIYTIYMESEIKWYLSAEKQ